MTLALACVLAAAALPGLTATAAEAASPRAQVRDSQPSWATPASKVAPAPAGKTVRARVYLAARDPAALDKAVTAVSTPSSPSYARYLTPAQYRARFGPAKAAAAQVTSWLRHSGLTVSRPQQNGRYVVVGGSVAAAERAFGTELAIFRHDGGSYQAPTAAITVPRAVAPDVLTVTGLDEAPTRATTKMDVGSASTSASVAAPSATYPAGYRTAKPCSLWYGQRKARTELGGKVGLPPFNGTTPPYAVCGYRPWQLRAGYGAPVRLTGKGVTIAVIDAYLSPTLRKDADQYAKNTGTQPFASGQLQTLAPSGSYSDQGNCGAPGWSGEQSLDVEAVHGFAPGANVLYAAGRSCSDSDLFDAQVAVVDDNRASIVSLSYGSLESGESSAAASLDTSLFKQAALQGIGFYVASGDNGDELISAGQKQVDTSGNNPYATAVGGTAVGLAKNGKYWFEAGWGTTSFELAAGAKSWITPSFVGGSGGGTSRLFPEPSYQKGIVGTSMPELTGRGVPDVAMDADPNTGMIVGVTQDFPEGVHYDQYRAGGTSLASPLFAAAQALASQALGKRLGFANPRIYALFKDQLAGGPKAFHDVTPAYDGLAEARADYVDSLSAAGGLQYTIRTFDDDTSLATRKGWDPVTGVGSPAAAFYTSGSSGTSGR